jgi:hypothetical protein
MAIIIQYRANHELAVDTIQIKHLPLLKFEMMPASLGDVLELMRMGIHTPCCDFMQQRLPQVGSRAINQNNLSLALLAKLIAQTSDQLKTTGTPTHHDDAMRPST